MIGPKRQRPTKKQEKQAYDDATERDQNRCVRCEAYGIQRDHRQNRQAGNTVVENLQGLCFLCHEWKGKNVRQALLDGFAVPRHARPELWPGFRVGVGWVLYYDRKIDGKWWQKITQESADLIMQEGGR